MTKRLIRNYTIEELDQRCIQDCWMIAAWNIESSLLESGATPGADYSRLDLYQLAQPFVLRKWKNGEVDMVAGMTVVDDAAAH